MTNEVLVAKRRGARLLGPPLVLLGEKWGSPAVCYPGEWVLGHWPAGATLVLEGMARAQGHMVETLRNQGPALCQRAVSVEGAQQWNSLSGYAFARLKNEL